MPAVLALLSSLLWGSADFVGGLLTRRLPAYSVVAASQAAGLVATTLVALATGAYRDDTGWIPWAILAGASGSLGLVAFYAALATGTMGVVSPIAALGAAVPVVAGIAAGEQPSTLALVGMVVALAGAVAASGPELAGATGARPVVLAVVAGAMFGLAMLSIARGAEHSTLMTLWGMRATSVSGFLVAALAVRTTGGLVVRDLAPLGAVGLGDAGANLMFALASTQGLVSVTAVLGSLYPVVTVLLARLVLHERLLRVQQAGVAAALVGVALLSLG
ncbi:EamA family transporter [Nocardioides sp.]|uniref:EamA family transporter n=1 Tax=Nocardioides sp. TaxID=35761 RepID=UPI0035270A37